MNAQTRLESYLEAATAALVGDEELRLDIKAELASHLQESAAEFEASGLAPEASLEAAIKSLGDPLGYAADLATANRSRMRLRGRVRLFLRLALVTMAVLAALLAFIPDFGLLTEFGGLGGEFNGDGAHRSVLQTCSAYLLAHRPGVRRTPDQQLILHGDRSRGDSIAAQRAIWEAHPTNIVFFNNYLTEALGRTPEAKQLEVLTPELARSESLDPGNARYRIIRAGLLLQAAATLADVTNAAGQIVDHRLDVRDRPMLDRAMQEFRRGLEMPRLRSYATDMVAARLAILGPPRSMQAQIKEIGIAAACLLPDMALQRKLAKATVPYAQLLIHEGRVPEARAYLDAWPTQTCQIAQDATTLIQILVANAIVSMASSSVTRVYQELGDQAAADRTMAAATVLYHPMAVWREQRKASVYQDAQLRRYSILASLLLPTLGAIDEANPEAFTPSRLVEYVLLDRFTMALIDAALFAILFGALLVSLRWRLVRGGASAPLLLLPDWQTVSRIQLWGVVVPLVVYRVWTLLPLGGRDFSLRWMRDVIFAQALLLLVAVVTLATRQCTRAVRARCLVLGLAVPPHGRRRVLAWGMGGLGLLALLFAQVLRVGLAHDAAWEPARVALAVAVGLVAAVAAGAAVWAFGCGLFGASRWGHYRGTVARSLIPHFAMAMLLLNLLTTPYLHWEEARLIRRDTVLSLSPLGFAIGFTSIEARLVQRLRSEFLDAAATLNVP